jgi:hypothetical protein
VLLLGHSQGSILVTAALATYLPKQVADQQVALSHRLALVTYGCPLTRLYANNFPAYFTPELIDDLRRLLTDDGDPTAPSAHESYLPDPPLPWHQRGDNAPPVRGHAETGYRTQAAFAEHLRAELARLRRHLHSAANARRVPPERDAHPPADPGPS